MAGGITEHDVHKAAATLVANGQKPTQTTVREFLGGGSFATIGPALKRWKKAQREQHELGEVELPDDLADALQQLGGRVWGAAIEVAESRLAGEREALAAAREDLEAEVQEHRDAVQQLEAEAVQRDKQVAELESGSATLKREVSELNGQLVAARAATAAEVAKTEAVFAERVSGLEARLADAQSTIEKLTALGAGA